MAESGIDFDLAQALVDLSLSPQIATKPEPQESFIRDTEAPSKPQNVLNEAASVSTPIRHIDPLHKSVIGVPSTPTEKAIQQDCLIVLQDACNLHKFSRQIRQKDLDSIVERPERTRAAILGIFLAQARLQAEARPHFDIHNSARQGWLGDQAVEKVHGSLYPQQLLEMSQSVGQALAQGKLEIPESFPYGDLYLGPESLSAINGCLGAVYDGMDALFTKGYKTTHVCIRPPGHHAAEASPCGFCWINNVHIGIAYARQKYGVKRAVILDFDLHHGDGSQAIAWNMNELEPDSIGYYSLHDIYSYPCEIGNVEKIREASVSIAAHGHHIHNVHLKPYTTIDEFDKLYESEYSTIFTKAAQYLQEGEAKGETSLVCISAGYDASEHESSSMQRHKVSVPSSFYQRFTRDAVALADRYSNGKVFSVMEGGYGDRAISSASCSHMIGLVDTTDGLQHAKEWYDLDNMKLLEKTFPAKIKGARRPFKVDGIDRPWMPILETLYDKQFPQIQPKQSIEGNMLDHLGRMTLRERKPGPPTPAPVQPIKSARKTPRSTPIKPRPVKAPVTPTVQSSIPPLPTIPAHLVALSQNTQSSREDSPTPRQSTIETVIKQETVVEAPTSQKPKVSDIYDFIE